jgi:hypothetical protein
VVQLALRQLPHSGANLRETVFARRELTGKRGFHVSSHFFCPITLQL